MFLASYGFMVTKMITWYVMVKLCVFIVIVGMNARLDFVRNSKWLVDVMLVPLTFVFSNCLADWLFGYVSTDVTNMCEAAADILFMSTCIWWFHGQETVVRLHGRIANLGMNLFVTYQAWSQIGKAKESCVNCVDIADDFWFVLSCLCALECIILVGNVADNDSYSARSASSEWMSGHGLLDWGPTVIDCLQVAFEAWYLSAVQSDNYSLLVIGFNIAEILSDLLTRFLKMNRQN